MTDDILIIGGTIVGIIIIVFMMVFAAVLTTQYVGISYIENIPVIVTQNGEKIYEGINGCIEVISGGDTTQVKVNSGFLCMFPKAVYVGTDITVKGSK